MILRARLGMAVLVLVLCTLPLHSPANPFDRLKGALNNARERASESYGRARERASESVQRATERAGEQLRNYGEAARERAGEMGRQFREQHQGVIDQARSRAIDWGSHVSSQAREKFEAFRHSHGDQMVGRLQEILHRHGERAAENFAHIAKKYGSQAASKLKETYEQYGSHLGERLREVYDSRGAEIADRVKSTMDRVGRTAGERLIEAYRHYQPRVAGAIHGAYDRYGEQMGNKAMYLAQRIHVEGKRHLTQENAQKAALAAVRASTLYSRFDRAKKAKTEQAIRHAASRINVRGLEGDLVTLEDFSKQWVAAKVPCLSGTTIAEDPVEALTYGVIYQDKRYIVKELRVLKSAEGEMISIGDGIERTGSLDVDRTIQMIELVDGFGTLADGSASAEDVMAAAELIQTANDMTVEAE